MDKDEPLYPRRHGKGITNFKRFHLALETNYVNPLEARYKGKKNNVLTLLKDNNIWTSPVSNSLELDFQQMLYTDLTSCFYICELHLFIQVVT